MLQINSESVQIMLMQIMERFDRIDRTLERMNKLKECLEGDTLLDNYDLCQLLGITKRTLARYLVYRMRHELPDHSRNRRSS